MERNVYGASIVVGTEFTVKLKDGGILNERLTNVGEELRLSAETGFRRGSKSYYCPFCCTNWRPVICVGGCIEETSVKIYNRPQYLVLA